MGDGTVLAWAGEGEKGASKAKVDKIEPATKRAGVP